MIEKTIEDAKEMIHNKLVNENKTLVQKNVQEALNLLRGAVMVSVIPIKRENEKSAQIRCCKFFLVILTGFPLFI